MTLGARIKAAMKHAGFGSATALAQAVHDLSGLDCSQQQISKLVRDDLKSGRSGYIYWIAKACQVRAEWLYEGVEPMIRNNQEHELLQLFRAVPVDDRQQLLKITATFVPGNAAQIKLLPAPDKDDPDDNLVQLESRR